jgi:hypothetical protein
VALSQLKELGEQAVAAVAASLVDGGAVLKAQLIASRFYEALQHELEQSSMDDAKRAALRDVPKGDICAATKTVAIRSPRRRATAPRWALRGRAISLLAR